MKKVILSLLVMLMVASLLLAGCKANKTDSTLPQNGQSTENTTGSEQTEGTGYDVVPGNTEGENESPIGDAELDIDVFDQEEEGSENGGQSGDNSQGGSGNGNSNSNGNGNGNSNDNGNGNGNGNGNSNGNEPDDPDYETPVDDVEDTSNSENTEPENTEPEKEETPKPTQPKSPVNDKGEIELPRIPG